eukprot:3875860-Rhodomonas_salina.1
MVLNPTNRRLLHRTDGHRTLWLLRLRGLFFSLKFVAVPGTAGTTGTGTGATTTNTTTTASSTASHGPRAGLLLSACNCTASELYCEQVSTTYAAAWVSWVDVAGRVQYRGKKDWSVRVLVPELLSRGYCHTAHGPSLLIAAIMLSSGGEEGYGTY